MKKLLPLMILTFLSALFPVFAHAAGIVTGLDIQALKLMMKMDKNILIVDVRPKNLVISEPTHIRNCKNLPLEELRKNPQLLQKYNSKTLVFVGRTEQEATIAANIAAEKRTHVYVIKGSAQEVEKAFGAQFLQKKNPRKSPAPVIREQPLPLEPVLPEKDVGEEEDFGC